jgi:hypothetical protein
MLSNLLQAEKGNFYGIADAGFPLINQSACHTSDSELFLSHLVVEPQQNHKW